MSTFPVAGHISDAARTEGEVKTDLEDTIKASKQIPGAGVADQALTIAAGDVTPANGASGILKIDTEGAAATDDLDHIIQTNIPDGSLVWMHNTNAARVVAVQHSAGGGGQISLQTGGDFVLADPDLHWLLLKRDGTTWKEVRRIPSADLAPILTKSGNYTTTVADRGRFIDCTATLTLTLVAAATAGKGFEQCVQCSGGITTIDPNGAETIGGALTLVLQRGDKVWIASDGTNWIIVQRFSAQMGPLDKFISGYTYANNGVDPTNDLDIAAGVAMDATGVYRLSGAAATKQSDTAWAVGTGAGMLDTGAIGNNDYYLWVIGRSDTGVVDYLSSLSSTAPTMPANYDYKRLFGWFKRVGGTIVAMDIYETEGGGVELNWDVPTLDVNLAATLGAARRTDAIKVPLNLSVLAHLNVEVDDAAGRPSAWIYCPDQADTAPSETVAPLFNLGSTIAITPMSYQIHVRTSATGTVASRALLTVDNFRISTMGFRWSRRN